MCKSRLTPNEFYAIAIVIQKALSPDNGITWTEVREILGIKEE